MEKIWILQGTNADFGKIVLVSPYDDPNRFRIGERKGRAWDTNLGLVFLASYLEQTEWVFDVARQVDPTKLLQICDRAIVGISVLPSNYKVGIEIAKAIKPLAKLVVMGGPYASTRVSQILYSQSSIDSIIAGAGEIPFAKIVAGKLFATIEGVAYRKGSVIVNPLVYLPLNQRPVPNRQLWPIKKEGTAVYWQDGCSVALAGKQCVFCTIQHHGMSRRTVDQVIAEMKILAGVECYCIEEGGDNFATGGLRTVKWLDELANKLSLKFQWLIHTSTRSLATRGIIPALSKVGVRMVQIGFETGDPLKKIKTKTSIKLEERIIAELQEFDIKIYGAWIIGLPGEDEKSLRQTVEQINGLYEKEALCGVMLEPLWPGPGSPAFTMLCSTRLEWAEKDFIEPEELLNAWFREYTKLTLDRALKIRDEVLGQIDVPIKGGMLL